MLNIYQHTTAFFPSLLYPNPLTELSVLCSSSQSCWEKSFDKVDGLHYKFIITNFKQAFVTTITFMTFLCSPNFPKSHNYVKSPIFLKFLLLFCLSPQLHFYYQKRLHVFLRGKKKSFSKQNSPSIMLVNLIHAHSFFLPSHLLQWIRYKSIEVISLICTYLYPLGNFTLFITYLLTTSFKVLPILNIKISLSLFSLQPQPIWLLFKSSYSQFHFLTFHLLLNSLQSGFCSIIL